MDRRNFLKLVAAGMAIASTKFSTKLRSAMAADQTVLPGASTKPNGSIPFGRYDAPVRKYRLSESAGITSGARW